MGKVWLCSDAHYFHDNIIKYCNRPFSDADQMNAEMERRWSLLVGPEDVMMFVGDLTAGLKGRKNELHDLIGRLPGRKVLVRGNHDHQDDEFYLSAGFEKVVDYVATGGLLFVHVPAPEETEHPHPWAAITRKLKEAHQPALIIHGHVHRADIPEFPGHFNCAVDRHNYMPFTLDTALARSGLGPMTESATKAIYEWLDRKTDDNKEDPPTQLDI